MPVYNSEKFVVESVKTVLNQTYENIQLIIVDDCSTDLSLDFIRNIEDERILILTNHSNMGVSYSRNLALSFVKGSYVFFIDSDDLWTIDKLESQLNFMTKNNINISCTKYDIIDEDGKKLYTVNPPVEISHKDILKQNRIGCSTVAVKSEIMKNYCFPEIKNIREDMALWLLISKDHSIISMPEVLTHYRVHNKSNSKNKLKMLNHQYRTYRFFLNFNVLKSIYYLTIWSYRSMLKYIKIDSRLTK